uniref:Spermatogenesis-associated protein 6 N-terminal domain-containing protein n=1 Tax=Oryzias sinensis TaxID=183150 RepID=A0A8C7WTB1_9TELE
CTMIPALQRAFKVRVSCPGVHLPAKEDVYLSVFVTGQYHQSECLPAVFPLLFQEKMTFEKVPLNLFSSMICDLHWCPWIT